MEICKLESIHSAKVGHYLYSPGSVVEVEVKSEEEKFYPHGVCSAAGEADRETDSYGVIWKCRGVKGGRRR